MLLRFIVILWVSLDFCLRNSDLMSALDAVPLRVSDLTLGPRDGRLPQHFVLGLHLDGRHALPAFSANTEEVIAAPRDAPQFICHPPSVP